MSENYSLKEMNEWADKVIDCISKWADEMNKAFNGTPTSIKIEKLDFSEHDKVFEDKIVSLEKQIEKMQAEKNTLRTRCMESARDNFDNGIYGCLTIVKYPNELETENISLKQKVKEYEDKIAELEKELEEWKEEARVVKKQRDEQLKSFRKGIEPYVDLLHMHETIAELKQRIAELEQSRSKWIERAVEWQQKCEKLESKETLDLPFNPLEAANYLINATYERETDGIERSFAKLPDKVNEDRYTIDDLEQIAEHLLVYCKHNKESEG